jgi:membrane protease YdiL (CAAX protease family)
MLATALGLVIGALLWGLRILLAPYLPAELPELGHRGVLGGLFVSVSAAIGEEVWLRLGVMTLLAWLIKRAVGHAELRPAVAWTAIGLAAFLFGLIHLPQLAAAGAASQAAVAATILGNMLVATAFGWLYWKRSLIAAIVAHFAVDVVLHVIPALV